MSLEHYALMRRATSHRTSSYDRLGGNVDCVIDIAPGDTVILLATDGPGKITHIWMTIGEYPGHETVFRDMVLRVFWEGSTVPSVEVPLGDFFGLGHALTPKFYERRNFQMISAPLAVGANERALNCYWPMPFRRAARIEIFNNGAVSCRQLFYHVDYELGEQPAEAGLFHANFHQDRRRPGQLSTSDYRNLDGRDNLLLLETTGSGHYAGCFFFVDTDAGGWWGEGDDMIFVDHSPMPVIYGTGSEDYFNNAWGYRKPFSFPYYGAPLLEKRVDGGEYNTAYRFHIPDPVHFQEHIRVTLECWWEPDQPIAVASVAFWYQEKPVASRVRLPRGSENHPRRHPLAKEDRWTSDTAAEGPGQTFIRPSELEHALRDQGIRMRSVCVVRNHFLNLAGFSGALVMESGGRELAIPLPVAGEGRYRVEVKPLYGELRGLMQIRLGDVVKQAQPELEVWEDKCPFLDLCEAESSDGHIILHLSGDPVVTLHAIRLTRLFGG